MLKVLFIIVIYKTKTKVNRTTEAQIFHYSNHPKCLPYQILGSKTVKNIQIDPQTTDILTK